MYESEKKELAEICKLLYTRRLVTACDGNISLRVSDEHILITPSGRNKGYLKPDEMILTDFDGNSIENAGKASREFPLHKLVYEQRPDISAVIHTHPIYATAFAMAGKNIPDDYLVESRVMLGKCGLAGYAPPGTMLLAEQLAPFIPTCNAVLLQNHGAVTYGVDLMDAFNKMEVLESIAQTIIMSRIIGEPVAIPYP